MSDQPAQDWEALEAPYFEWLDEPAPAERTLVRRTLVRAVRTGRIIVCDSGDLGLVKGEHVLVESDDGRLLGEVVDRPALMLTEGARPPRVLRRTTGGDERKAESLQRREVRSFDIVLAGIQRFRLDMKLIRVQHVLGINKTLVFFGAEDRVDYRDLVQHLARELRTRVEMRQIGPRDETAMLGGIGVCGRELCCTTWLQGFSPVSIRHAKSQNLHGQLDKMQGVCGRLMCCLVYEHESYKELRKGMPRVGRTLETPKGPGRVREINIPLRTVRVQLDSGAHQTFSMEQLETSGPATMADGNKAAPSTPRSAKPEDRGSPDAKSAAPPAEGPWTDSRRKRRRRRGRERPGQKAPPGGSPDGSDGGGSESGA